MRRNTRRILQAWMLMAGNAFIFASVLATTSAEAASAYRCSAQGQTVYSDMPCPQGHEVTIPLTSNQPSAADVAAARHRAQAEKLQLEKIEAAEVKEHLQAAAEQKKSRQHAEAIERQCLHLKMKMRRAEEAVKSSSAHTSAEKKRKARHAEEAYADECETTTARTPRLLIP